VIVENCEMTPPMILNENRRILALGAQKWSYFMIVKELNKLNRTIHKSTVAKPLKKHEGAVEIKQLTNNLPVRIGSHLYALQA
jgi:hypothetical protein